MAKASWSALDEKTQKDLLTWFNVGEPTYEDKERLALLSQNGGFEAWDCPDCGDRVYEGTPTSWANFQGVMQVDYTSYPGNKEKYTPKYLKRMCDDCRMRR